MSASMLDEVEIPVKKQPLHICPCCKFTFTDINEFIKHCYAMRDTIETAVQKAVGNK